MLRVTSIYELRKAVTACRGQGRSIGFVPTMGALHEGHLSLVRLARKVCDTVVVSIFVNPTQFGPQEDYQRYPRQRETDCELLEKEHTDIVYIPSVTEMYAEDASVTVDPGPVSQIFEGAVRPGHFRGVLTVVAKLFLQVQPDRAFFGQKDAQQLFLIRKMVKDLNFPVEIIAGDTIREKDGLALSSRNVYLKQQERKDATVLYQSMLAARDEFQAGERGLGELQRSLKKVLETIPELKVDYATIVSDETFQENDPVSENARMIVAGRLGSVRLIDNMSLK